MIAEVDKDGSGAIDFDEFKHMMNAKIGERDSKEELMKAFQIIDQDKNVHIVTLLIVFLSVYIYFFKLLALFNNWSFETWNRGKYLLQTFSVSPGIWEKILLIEKFKRWLMKQIVIVSFTAYW